MTSEQNVHVGASETMLRMLVGCWVSQALYIAAKLGIADLVQDTARTNADLAEVTQTDAGSLYRVLRALASLGVFEEQKDGRFALTPLADALRAEVPGSLRAFAIMLGEKEHWRAWGDCLHSVRTGQPAFDHVFGAPHFQYFARNSEAAKFFNEGMTSRAGPENDAIVSACDFSKFSTVVDVGGGEGTLLTAIMDAAPRTNGILFDLPHVVEARRSAGKQAQPPNAPRLQFSAGSFFEAVPRGGDAYVLKKVIHDWDDERALSILKACRNAMSPSARLLIIEPVIPDGNVPSFNKLLDLMMLVWTSGGRERTERELGALLAATGLEPIQIIQTNSPLVIIEAMPLA